MQQQDIDIQKNEGDVSKAFSTQSVVFDAIDKENKLITWVRERVRKEVLQYLPANPDMLELNCGTGIDAVFFAQKGHRIHATDNADGMLQQLRQKVDALSLGNKLIVQKCSYNALENIQGKQYDYIFSNFGGLNCTKDLADVLDNIDRLLKPGGRFTLVIMPKICPWEIIMMFKGMFKTAFRRFRSNGAKAHLEGTYFQCYYYSPSFVTGRLAKNFRLTSLKGLSIVVPPPFIEQFMEKHPTLFNRLEQIENRIWDKAPFNRWCDHYMITMEKTA